MPATGWAVGMAAAVLLGGTAVADEASGQGPTGSTPDEAISEQSGGAHPEKTLRTLTRTEGDGADAPKGDATDAKAGDTGRVEPTPEPR